MTKRLKTLEEITKPFCSTEHGKLEGQDFTINGETHNGMITGEAVREELRQWAINMVKLIGRNTPKKYWHISGDTLPEELRKETTELIGRVSIMDFIQVHFDLTEEDLK